MEDIAVNNKALRQLIEASFDDNEFQLFCFDYFDDATKDFHYREPLSIKAMNLASYCIRHGQLEKLLGAIQESNTYQYNRYKKSLFEKTALAIQSEKIPENVETDMVHLSIPNIDLDELSSEQRAGVTRGVKAVLSSELNLPIETVKIMRMRPGSILIDVSIPTVGIRPLLELHENGNLSSLSIVINNREVARLKKKLSTSNRNRANLKNLDVIQYERLVQSPTHSARPEYSVNELLFKWEEASEAERYTLWLNELKSDDRAALWMGLSEEDKETCWNLLKLYWQTKLWKRLPQDEQMRLWNELPFQKKINFWGKLTQKDQLHLWARLSENTQNDLFRELSSNAQAQLWQRLPDGEKAKWWFAMSPDSFAILLWSLYPDQMIALLEGLPEEATEFLLNQLSFSERVSLVERVPEKQQNRIQWMANP